MEREYGHDPAYVELQASIDAYRAANTEADKQAAVRRMKIIGMWQEVGWLLKATENSA